MGRWPTTAAGAPVDAGNLRKDYSSHIAPAEAGAGETTPILLPGAGQAAALPVPLPRSRSPRPADIGSFAAPQVGADDIRTTP